MPVLLVMGLVIFLVFWSMCTWISTTDHAAGGHCNCDGTNRPLSVWCVKPYRPSSWKSICWKMDAWHFPVFMLQEVWYIPSGWSWGCESSSAMSKAWFPSPWRASGWWSHLWALLPCAYEPRSAIWGPWSSLDSVYRGHILVFTYNWVRYQARHFNSSWRSPNLLYVWLRVRKSIQLSGP